MESTRKKQSVFINDSAAKRAGPDEFGRSISKIAVSQICESVGFEGFNESALESLADIAVRYLQDLGKTAHSYSISSGRTTGNLFDVLRGLEDLGSSAGFPGASEATHSVVSSGAVREIMEYVETAEEIPFAQPVPHFPVVRDRKPIPSFLQMGETPGPKNIPSWLPAFPDPHTYIHSPVWNERTTDPRADKLELARQRRKAERSLLSLQQRMVSNGDMVPSTSTEPHPQTEEVELNGSQNPFLAKPLPSGDKDVASVILPDKLMNNAHTENNFSMLETFAPAIEAMKEAVSELGNEDEKVLPEKRPAVSLKFRTGKKVFGESLDLRLKRASGRAASWFARDDEKDDKKRRAEFILRQSVENQQDLTQL